mmetsp:Transcript_130786/g.279764  ORF Transcript_130786/g.279764 Transcript_130786/m.279764 type:complete len:178 (-) Transcript_130786:173-706(-)
MPMEELAQGELAEEPGVLMLMEELAQCERAEEPEVSECELGKVLKFGKVEVVHYEMVEDVAPAMAKVEPQACARCRAGKVASVDMARRTASWPARIRRRDSSSRQCSLQQVLQTARVEGFVNCQSPEQLGEEAKQWAAALESLGLSAERAASEVAVIAMPAVQRLISDRMAVLCPER